MVRKAAISEIVSLGYAGSFIFNENRKIWLIIYTCATFREAHFELAKSLSTKVMLLKFSRFIARRGRNIIYTDNLKNLIGVENLLNKIDCTLVEYNSISRKYVW